MSVIWERETMHWKNTTTWIPSLSTWIRSFLNGRGIRHLQRMGEQEICWDDSDWLKKTQTILKFDIEYVIECLANALSVATVRSYHGCRTKDAGAYHRQGIQRNDPVSLAEDVRRVVMEEELLRHLRPVIEQRLHDFEHKDRDVGRLYLALDDRTLTNGAGHYLLYGSEWVQCVLGFEAHLALRRRGFPTVLLVDLPLNMVTGQQRVELARALLQEWTRIKVNRPSWIPELDFTFCLRRDLPSPWVVDHYHPSVICDPFYQNKMRLIEQRHCPSCAPESRLHGI